MAAELKLREYQERGVQWLCDTQPYKLLADDMGLGKTPQSIEAMNRLGHRTAVIVCPATVKIMWARKLAMWAKTLGNIFIVKAGDVPIPAWADVIILSYRMVIRPRIARQLIARGVTRGYDVVLFDESRALKNMETKCTKFCLGKKAFSKTARRIWLLDGTPVPNRPVELFPVLFALAQDVIMPYNTYNAFGERFCRGKRDVFGWDMTGHSNVEELSERLRNSNFFLRRTKEEVMDDLPEKVETYIEVDAIIDIDATCAPIATVRRALGIAKIPSAIEYIANVVAEAGKVVVFAYHRDVIEGLQSGLNHLNPVIVYGGMSDDEKQESIDRFMNDPLCGVIINQILAGGSGVDGLQEVSCHMVFVEQDWSPGVMDQAIDRCRRIGQKATAIFVHYLTVAGSIDEPMTDVLNRKRAVITRLMQSNDEPDYCVNEKGSTMMTIENELKRIADALEAHNALQGVGVTAAKKEPKGKGAKGEAETAVPETTAALPAQPQATATAAGPTLDDALAAISTFLSGTEGEQAEALKNTIRSKILTPKYGVGSVKELAALPNPPYAAFIEDLQKGPAAYAGPAETPATKSALDALNV